MSGIDRAEAHRRVDAFYDALDACQTVNDPDRDAEAREDAFAAYKRVRETGADLEAERQGAALLSRQYFSPAAPWGVAARKASSLVASPLSLKMDQDELAAQRWALARFILDHEDELLPNLARNAVLAMLSLNLGVHTSFTKPFRVQGLKSAGAPNATIQFFSVTLVYYLAGYRDCKIEDVLRAEMATLDGMSRDNLNTIVRRLGIASTVKEAREMGRADRAARRPEKGPFPIQVDLALLAKLRKNA